MFRLSTCKSPKLKLVEEKNTEYTYQCPVCGGKLKEKKSNGAYTCFTSYCSPDAIREKLGVSKSSNYVRHRTFTETTIIKPVKWIEPIQYLYIDKYELARERKQGIRQVTSYIYNDDCMVERVDYWKDGIKHKDFFPKYKRNGVWTYGVSRGFGLFNGRYIKERGTLIITEGEKCADIVTDITGCLATSFPAFAWDRQHILFELIKLSRFISGIIYLPDNDAPGRRKANLVQDVSWEVNIPCTIVPLSQEYEMEEAEDIVDLYNKGYDVKQILENVNVRL
jgi:hypothetical protein